MPPTVDGGPRIKSGARAPQGVNDAMGEPRETQLKLGWCSHWAAGAGAVEMISESSFGDYQYFIDLHESYLPLSGIQNLFSV